MLLWSCLLDKAKSVQPETLAADLRSLYYLTEFLSRHKNLRKLSFIGHTTKYIVLCMA